MNKLGIKAFSLVETLVAAAVIGVAVLSVIAVVRKGQEQMVVDKHRRPARAIVDTILEAPQYSPGKFNSITDTTITGSFTLDTDITTHSNLLAKDTIRISSQTISGVPYKKIRAKLHWGEPVGGVVDSVAMERWIPNIPSPINIAPMASSITARTSFAMCNFMGRGDCSPEWYFCYAWSAVDGVIGTRMMGDWSAVSGDPDPWISFKWSKKHKVYKMVLYNRTNPAGCWPEGANINLYNGISQVGNTISLSSGFSNGSCNTVFFSPREIDSIWIKPTTINGHDYLGFSEIEIYE